MLNKGDTHQLWEELVWDPETEVEVLKPEPQPEDEEIMLTENLPLSRATFLDWYVYKTLHTYKYSGGNFF